MRKALFVGVLALLTVLILVSSCKTAPQAAPEGAQPEVPAGDDAAPAAGATDDSESGSGLTGGVVAVGNSLTVEVTSTGFNPASITVKAGDTVTWVNKQTGDVWPATNLHPTHRGYPGSSITKCNSKDVSDAFDACGRVRAGDSYSFTFTEKGSWSYHDHLHPRLTGTVVVE